MGNAIAGGLGSSLCDLTPPAPFTGRAGPLQGARRAAFREHRAPAARGLPRALKRPSPLALGKGFAPGEQRPPPPPLWGARGDPKGWARSRERRSRGAALLRGGVRSRPLGWKPPCPDQTAFEVTHQPAPAAGAEGGNGANIRRKSQVLCCSGLTNSETRP